MFHYFWTLIFEDGVPQNHIENVCKIYIFYMIIIYTIDLKFETTYIKVKYKEYKSKNQNTKQDV